LIIEKFVRMAGVSRDKASSDVTATGDARSNFSFAFAGMYNDEHPSLRWLFVMLLIEFAAFAMLIPVLPFFLMQEIGLGPVRVGQLLSAFSLAQMIGSWAGGRVSDAYGRRFVIIAVFAWAGVGFAATAFTTTFVEIFVVRVLQGLSGGTAALCDAYLLDVVAMDERAAYVGFSGAVKGMAFVFGPGIGALLNFLGLPRRMIFLVTGALAVLAAGLGLAFLEESLPEEKRRPLFRKQETAEAAAAADWEAVNAGLLLIARFFSALGLGFLFATYAFLIKDNFGWSDMHFGMVLFSTGLTGACFQSLVFPRVATLIGVGWCASVGAACGSAAFTLLPVKSLGVHVFGLAMFTLSGALLEPSLTVLIGVFASERHLGFATGIAASCRALAIMVSPLVAGMLYGESPRLAYYAAAGCFAVTCLMSAVIAVLARSTSTEAERLRPHASDKNPSRTNAQSP